MSAPTSPPSSPLIDEVTVRTWRQGDFEQHSDYVAAEEPLEVQVVTHEGGLEMAHSIAVTMRTPGHDAELALGFLFTESVLPRRDWVTAVRHAEGDDGPICNRIQVHLHGAATFDLAALSRHVFTSSSCGICGKITIEQVRAKGLQPAKAFVPPPPAVLTDLPRRLRAVQQTFDVTGGLHASALFDGEGKLLEVWEDVGRHNALDKLIGSLWRAGSLPAHDRMLLVSGRASFELVQKAVFAGFPLMAAIGAPSSLAVELAREFGIALIGFLRDGRYNLYT